MPRGYRNSDGAPLGGYRKDGTKLTHLADAPYRSTGRPPKTAVEHRRHIFRELAKSVTWKEVRGVLDELKKMVAQGDAQAAKVWLEYCVGKPDLNLNHNHQHTWSAADEIRRFAAEVLPPAALPAPTLDAEFRPIAERQEDVA